MNIEIENIKKRYDVRSKHNYNLLYDPLNPSVYMSQQELERKLLKLFNNIQLQPLCQKKVLEVGCGTGTNLLKFIKYGFSPENLTGNELLHDRIEKAKKILPNSVKLLKGDASKLELEPGSFDIVFQSTVFTSILDNNLKQNLASKMWELLKPGGYILWYDFVYNNPKNNDVKGISIKKIKELFPEGISNFSKITLAPPINRIFTNFNPSFYYFFNSFPLLRTHVLGTIQK